MESIDVGLVPNNNLGDKVRNAFIKVNSNFDNLDNNKADLVGGKVPSIQLPTKTISESVPSGVPANGDEWIIYNN